ncbi:hypothetical protein BT69DRAFT_1291957 [Atractiella rhizophila]|nr:hypothetical protein BT69DRAFT_1291957 [Atractiella rhizophila]
MKFLIPLASVFVTLLSMVAANPGMELLEHGGKNVWVKKELLEKRCTKCDHATNLNGYRSASSVRRQGANVDHHPKDVQQGQDVHPRNFSRQRQILILLHAAC